jgi:hypothetical protein
MLIRKLNEIAFLLVTFDDLNQVMFKKISIQIIFISDSEFNLHKLIIVIILKDFSLLFIVKIFAKIILRMLIT